MSSSTVEQVKERLGIVEVVSQYLKLEKAGSNLKAKCPFHNEKTPSFMVSPVRNTFYCFGCNEKGDIFTFVEKFEGVDFTGALKVLGERAGVVIVLENPQKKDERVKLYSVLEEATVFFEKNLKTEKKVLTYLRDRGVEDKTIHLWRLGFAPASWDALYQHLQKKYSENDIEKAGLIKRGEKKDGSSSTTPASADRFYDRFRDRIMFPIADGSGRIVGFSGRIFKDDGKSAKYINSPETSLYNKSRILYGYDKSKLSIRKFNFSLVVEGQMDLLMSHQAGYTNTVALSGTALTQDQLTLLQRLSSNIVMAFDADSAGMQSAGKGATMALAKGMDVKVAPMPEGMDPADLVKAGKDEWKKSIKNSKHIIDFYLDVLSTSIKDKRKLRLEVSRIVIPFVAKISNTIDRAHFVGRVAEYLGISEEPVWEEVRKLVAQAKPHNLEATMDHILPANRTEAIGRILAVILTWKKEPLMSSIDTKTLKKRFIKIIGDKQYKNLQNIVTNNDDHQFRTEQHMGHLTENFSDPPALNAYIEELLVNLEKEYVEEECNSALEKLKDAEASGNQKKLERAEKKYKKLTDTLTKLKEKMLAS